MKRIVSRLLGNKVAIYLLTRYIVYFITFITSMIMAGRLGPYYMGVWGSIILLLRYFQIFDFGISNSMTVLLVQNKTDKQKCDNLEMSAMVLLCLMSFLVVIIAIYNYFFGIRFLEKFDLGNRFYFVCLIAIFQYLNDYGFRVSRVKGRMFVFTFYQTFLNVVLLPVVLFGIGDSLIDYLIRTYIASHFVCLCLFIFCGGLSFQGRFYFSLARVIIFKGLYLFIYNFCFYLVILSTKTIIADNYSVDEFGYFSFSYTLAHAALLLLTAFSSLITPKLIDKFNTDDVEEIERTIAILRTNYVACSHFIMYLAMAFFPLLIMLLPKYQGALTTINLTSLAVVVSANSFGYISFLMTKNKERTLALNTFLMLAVNIVLALLLAVLLKVDYSRVVLATLFSYIFYAIIVVYKGKTFLNQQFTLIGVVREVLPMCQLIPLLCACYLSIVGLGSLMWIPLVIFTILNMKELLKIAATVKMVLIKPSVIDMQK